MKPIIIKYRNGKYTLTKFPVSNFHASQAEQLLEQIQDELREFAGDYAWSLEGDTYSGYKVVASYKDYRVTGKKMGEFKFLESTGKTPAKALMNCNAVRHVLMTRKLIEV